MGSNPTPPRALAAAWGCMLGWPPTTERAGLDRQIARLTWWAAVGLDPYAESPAPYGA